MSIFENLLRKFRFDENLTRITGILYDDLCTFMMIYLPVLLRMRNISDESYIEHQNTHFISNNVFPRIMPFMK